MRWKLYHKSEFKNIKEDIVENNTIPVIYSTEKEKKLCLDIAIYYDFKKKKPAMMKSC